MKKVLWFMLMLVTMTATAQKDVTKFLGFPVDGNKEDIKEKLKAKGFSYDAQHDFFKGEFNGHDSHIYVVTNNNKVYRIMVCDANNCDETNIKIRFNNLCHQFAQNKKYIPLNEKGFIIPEKEDISYEMLVNNKRYEASYCQIPDTTLFDATEIQNRFKNTLLKKFTQEQIDNPTEQQQEEMKSIIEQETTNILFDIMEKKLVWFMISKNQGEYFISIFYDNEYNHSNGEDL